MPQPLVRDQYNVTSGSRLVLIAAGVMLSAPVAAGVLHSGCSTDGSYDAETPGAHLSWACRSFGTFPSTTAWSVAAIALLVLVNGSLLFTAVRPGASRNLVAAMTIAAVVNVTVLVLGLTASTTYSGQG